MSSAEAIRLYRNLYRQINNQFTSVNGNLMWKNQLQSAFRAASAKTEAERASALRDARDTLNFLTSTKKYQDLYSEFNPKMSDEDRIKRSANRVGLGLPKTVEPKS
ncbi:hypothetical protein H4219_001177 [Mycoemilia scoparia]|uniref:Complex 1 LYR protein n=1 Tax=Mycoemilia scoparia TaxID=417184 RepID=A0A9W8A6J7_9FUNG|nr:hypothetical protein H4219_001177 [Mycoemilia scoparia]